MRLNFSLEIILNELGNFMKIAKYHFFNLLAFSANKMMVMLAG
jgi:hypothetical protein